MKSQNRKEARIGKEEAITLERLAKKGLRISFRVYDVETWRKMVEADPAIPRSYRQLRRLRKLIYGTKMRRLRAERAIPGIVTRLFEECGESLRHRFFAGLGNPFLTVQQRNQLEADIDADTPVFDNSIETDHFILRWTNSSTNTADNISDSSIIDETGDYLETAWMKYNTVFGKAPYVRADSSKIEVNFYDLGGGTLGSASPPDGPIELDADSWVSEPGIRQPTSAHELFHKLQYAFGYRTTWTPTSPYKWFSEGTAAWAEVFVWQRVSRAYKVNGLFDNPDLNLYDGSYRVLPFWIFFQTRLEDTPDYNTMADFLRKYEATGDEQHSLSEVVEDNWPPNNVYRKLDNFFALFAREKRIGAWRQTPTGGQPYSTILDPDGNDIVPTLTMTGVSLGRGDSYSNTGSVSQLGSDYYAFNFENDAEGQVFSASVTGVAGGDYSYYLIWEKNGAFKKAIFPSFITRDYGFSETIDLATADSLILIISGRGNGGSYTVNASVSS